MSSSALVSGPVGRDNPNPEHRAELNVAASCVGTASLGPGLRSVVWVQGCPLNCADCLAPDWIPFRPARRVSVAHLTRELLEDPQVTGLTLSGGEPMTQAKQLAHLVQQIRAERDVDVICYSGFRWEGLHRHPPFPGVRDLLGCVDVLVDGPYVRAHDDGRGIRGSSNQRVIHLTSRLRHHDLAGCERSVELRFRAGEVHLVGVPPPGLLAHLDVLPDLVSDLSVPQHTTRGSEQERP